MMGKTEMRATRQWVWQVTMSILAFGLAATVVTVQAASENSPPTALGSAQLSGAASALGGEESFVPVANIVPTLPYKIDSCCVQEEGLPTLTCIGAIPAKQCRLMQGIPVISCQCPEVQRSRSTEGEIDTMGDEFPATEPADSSPLNTSGGSIWALLVVTMFVAGP